MQPIINALVDAGFRPYQHSLIALEHGNGVRLFLKKGYFTVSGVEEGECPGLLKEEGKRDTAFCRHRLPLVQQNAEDFAAAIKDGKVVVNKARSSRGASGGTTRTQFEEMLRIAASKES